MSAGKGSHSNDISENDIFYRIAGHSAMLFILLRTSISVTWALLESIPTHPEIQKFLDLGPRYATVWNANIQLVYASTALACDLTEVLNKDDLIPKKLRKFRYTLFSSLFYPMAMTLPIVFWPIYIYDRELVFPRKVDIFISFAENFIYHGLVTMYALYELAFIPKYSLKNRKTYKYIIWFFTLFYIVFYFTKYVDLGLWIYEVYDVLEGSIGFHLLLSSPVLYATIFYLTQEWTQKAIWKYRESLQTDIKAV